MGWAARTKERVVIATPRGGTVHGPFHDSVVALEHDQWRNRPPAEILLTAVLHCSGLYVEDNRHFMAKRFLKEHTAPWLLMVDSDISFPVNLLDQMLEAAHSRDGLPDGPIRVLAGNVPLDIFPNVAYVSTPQPGSFGPLKQLPPEPIFEVDAAATAIMLIHREVLRAIAQREGACWFYRHKVEGEEVRFIEEDGTEYPMRTFDNLGEDVSFCLRARSAGFPPWVYSGLTGVIHHNLAATKRQLREAEAEIARLRGVAKEKD